VKNRTCTDEIGERKKHLCANYGFIGLYPSDNELQSDKDIFAANMKMISEADCGIFNLTPFRGPSADVGTVFELGVMVTLGKPVFGYTNSMRDYATRCRQDHRINRMLLIKAKKRGKNGRLSSILYTVYKHYI
jgi:nucleoside 2-deoxyribosyltransferase